jgi:ABC-type Na+ efflux pump permease subunit
MLVMVLFMAVQYNDPDGALWMSVYAVPAIWCAMAALRPQWFQMFTIRIALQASIFLSVVAVIWFWPDAPEFWTKVVWYDTEGAREGLGVMIVAIVLVIVWWTVCSRRSSNEVS